MTPGMERTIDEAVRRLEAGELVAFPTETVYGLGADASNRAAVARIFSAKGRPADHPLIIHLGAAGQVGDWAREIPVSARRLADAFWPGPLTLVLPRADCVLDEVTGGQDTVALRVPSHPVARELLLRFGRGVAAPSANRFGRISPTCAAHVRDELGDRVGLVIDGGECEVGLESTIVACDANRVTLLRPGKITLAELERIVGRVDAAGAAVPRVPGSLRSHYAPTTPIELVEVGTVERRCAEGSAAEPNPRPRLAGSARGSGRFRPRTLRGAAIARCQRCRAYPGGTGAFRRGMGGDSRSPGARCEPRHPGRYLNGAGRIAGGRGRIPFPNAARPSR
jgi:L-threonylcarbamoyladenylate synthase